jgi:hypothetical protein
VQSSADLLEYQVAFVVTERVVDLLEPVQVEHQDADAFASRLGRGGDGGVQRFLQGFSVGHPSEVVKAGCQPEHGLLTV